MSLNAPIALIQCGLSLSSPFPRAPEESRKACHWRSFRHFSRGRLHMCVQVERLRCMAFRGHGMGMKTVNAKIGQTTDKDRCSSTSDVTPMMLSRYSVNGINRVFTVIAAMRFKHPSLPSSPVLSDRLGQNRHLKRQHGPRCSPRIYLKEQHVLEGIGDTYSTTPENIDMT